MSCPPFLPILAIPSTPSCDQRCFALGLDETHHATQKDHGSKPWFHRAKFTPMIYITEPQYSGRKKYMEIWKHQLIGSLCQSL